MMESILIKIADSWLRNLMKTADLVTCTEEILNGKLHVLCSDVYPKTSVFSKIFSRINKLFPACTHVNFSQQKEKTFWYYMSYSLDIVSVNEL